MRELELHYNSTADTHKKLLNYKRSKFEVVNFDIDPWNFKNPEMNCIEVVMVLTS